MQQIHNPKPPIILQPSQYENEFSIFQSLFPLMTLKIWETEYILWCLNLLVASVAG